MHYISLWIVYMTPNPRDSRIRSEQLPKPVAKKCQLFSLEDEPTFKCHESKKPLTETSRFAKVKGKRMKSGKRANSKQIPQPAAKMGMSFSLDNAPKAKDDRSGELLTRTIQSIEPSRLENKPTYMGNVSKKSLTGIFGTL
jgi:hypothetical protein